MSLSLELRDVSGTATGSVQLDETIFGIQPNVPVMHQVVTAQLAAARSGTQSTKTRAEVAGGGKKPFKQKGTGRARQGSERAPHFTGGGIALGPKPRSYRQKTPRKMIQLALRSALSDRASEGRVAVVASWPWEAPSTRDAKAALAALGLDGRVLVVLSRQEQEAYKSFRNLRRVQVLLSGELNAYDVLCNDWIVFTTETLPGGGATGETVAAAETTEAAEMTEAAETTEAAEPADIAEPGAELAEAGEPGPADEEAPGSAVTAQTAAPDETGETGETDEEDDEDE
jgi:large subunit ribosomal protein L4